MRPIRYTIHTAISIILCLTVVHSYGQLGISFDLKKPQEYDDRVLRSEKSDEKKFNLPRRFIQNTVTRYNYFFNANNKLNEVIARAKDHYQDDFSKLLPFYNYSLDATIRDSIQLDSIIYKSESGIALHDLRNDWADNLYLLWGAAYYLKKEFDSAYLMFQFINYAFADKEKDGYYKTIGSSMDGNKAFSIATREKTSLPKKIFAEPPSRNDAFIWQIRNFLIQDQFAEAASLIITLKNDPVFPKRLNDDLNEVQAWWFYKQNMWDSAAPHLANALNNATNRNEKARWEYLTAQLYEMAGKNDEAEKYYSKVIGHTTDPIMEVYARLNSIRVNKSGGENYVDRNIAELLKMAKKDKYEEYRDIIYFMAAQMQLERNNIDGAEVLLKKSIQYNSGNVAQRNKAFLQLAEIAFNKKLYKPAYNFYDSINLGDQFLPDTALITKRRDILGKIVSNIEIVERQDSLQKIAAMPEDERKEFVKKLVKDLHKQQGIKEEGNYSSVSPFGQQTSQNPFSNTNPKGDWYFYNQDSRIKGHNDFITLWGNRANTDNWRRSSTSSGIRTKIAQQTDDKTNPSKDNTVSNGTGEVSFDELYNKLPLTPEKIKISDDSISVAMFNLGKLYAQEIEDCGASIETFENLRTRFPKFDKMDEVLFGLFYCYNKNGETAKAEQIKKLLSEKYPKSNFTTIVVTGKDPQSKANNPEATKEYEKIYDLFIEGNFVEAIAQKKIADSLYGKNYWTPQLLYIEAVYYIKQRQDSIAKNVLNSIISQFPKTKIADRAVTMLDVLSRRNQIEKELQNWTIRESKQDNNRPVYQDSTSFKPKQLSPFNKNDSTKNNVVINKPPVVDTTSAKPVQQNSTTPFSFTPDAVHYVMIVLTKVDPIFSGEAKNAFFRYNRENYYNKTMAADIDDLDAENRLLLISPFKNAEEAIDYINKAKPLAPTEIIPWLKGGKYIFSIITDKNLELLKANKDMESYKKFLSEKFPGKL